MIRIIKDGISIDGDNVIMNTDSDSPDDILNTVNVKVCKADFIGNTYYFGYYFNKNTSSKHRTMVLRWLKNIDGSGIDENSLRKFIRKPLMYLNNTTENLLDFNCLIYPKSDRSNLTHIIVNEIYKLTSHDMKRKNAEIVKSLPSKIDFDWESFIADNEWKLDDNAFKQIKEYINNTLLPHIHDLTYFSLAKEVKYRYRPYIKNYLVFKDKESEELVRAIQKGKILIVDDINTSGSTLTEILRLVHNINNSCEIYIFTLIGKE